MGARMTHFSHLIKFGFPVLFVTVNPDDGHGWIIVLCALKKVKSHGDMTLDSLNDKDIVAQFKLQQKVRVNHPGLCTEEHNCVIELNVKHLFNWDIEEQKARGPWMFAVLLAFCLATEEQALKSVHGHFLLFVKNWQQMMAVLQ